MNQPPVFFKNPAVATILSFFFMGLGQIYNGQIGKGIIFMVTYAFSILLMFIFIGFISTPILWILGMIDAHRSAQTINQQLAQDINVIPMSGSVIESFRSAFSPTTRPATLDAMIKKCPECAETIKLEALVCRFCHYRFDAEDVQRHVAGAQAELERDQSGTGSGGFGDAASDLKECPECHEMVWSGIDECPACSYDFRKGTIPSTSRAERMSFTVVLDHIPPPRRSILKGILRELHPAMSDADVDAALGHPEVIIARGLSLQEANILMLKFHDQGFGPRKQREV